MEKYLTESQLSSLLVQKKINKYMDTVHIREKAIVKWYKCLIERKLVKQVLIFNNRRLLDMCIKAGIQPSQIRTATALSCTELNVEQP